MATVRFRVDGGVARRTLFVGAGVVAGMVISVTLYEAAFASLVGLTRRRAADAIGR